MKRLTLLLITLGLAFASHADDKPSPKTVVNQITQGVGISEGSGGSHMSRFVTSYADKSVWYFPGDFARKSRPVATYCWVEEPDQPKCKTVRRDQTPKP